MFFGDEYPGNDSNSGGRNSYSTSSNAGGPAGKVGEGNSGDESRKERQGAAAEEEDVTDGAGGREYGQGHGGATNPMPGEAADYGAYSSGNENDDSGKEGEAAQYFFDYNSEDLDSDEDTPPEVFSVSVANPHALIGHRVARYIPDESDRLGLYFGYVKNFVAESRLWVVEYDDGEEENFMMRQLAAGIRLAAEKAEESDREDHDTDESVGY